MKYLVNVEGKEFITDFSFEGYLLCLQFIHDNATDDKKYQIKIIK